MSDVPHIPILRAGREYESLAQTEVAGHRDGAPLARVSQANAGLIRRDVRRIAESTAPFRALSHRERLAICRDAARRFASDSLPLGGGSSQTPDEYVSALSATSGLPHALCRRNMDKVLTVLDGMEDILCGLTRGMDASLVDTLAGEHAGLPVCYRPAAEALGVVLPSNSPGVNSIWMPAVALGVPVVLKPGREEPWTPVRIVQAFIAAGCPREAFSFYPTDHEGAAVILDGCGRSLLFGDESTTRAYAGNPAVQIHGPGRSKVLLGPDAAAGWRDHLDVLVASIADNGGRSCINASSILVPAHGDEIADALAEELAKIGPRPAGDEHARLAAFANPAVADFIDATIERELAAPGAEDVSARHRGGPRSLMDDGARYLLPTIVRCESIEHPLARTEFLFPFASVTEMPPEQMVAAMGPSLVVTAITRDRDLIGTLLRSPHVDRINLGPVPTTHVEWDQPHEGNLFELLFERRAIQRAPGWDGIP